MQVRDEVRALVGRATALKHEVVGIHVAVYGAVLCVEALLATIPWSVPELLLLPVMAGPVKAGQLLVNHLLHRRRVTVTVPLLGTDDGGWTVRLTEMGETAVQVVNVLIHRHADLESAEDAVTGPAGTVLARDLTAAEAAELRAAGATVETVPPMSPVPSSG